MIFFYDDILKTLLVSMGGLNELGRDEEQDQKVWITSYRVSGRFASRKVSWYDIGYQLLRSATSVGANYRAACRGRSQPDFISKIGIAIEEADESLYWMELLVESGISA